MSLGVSLPKVGQEPRRRAALVDATIHEIGASGSLDVTVSQIAKRAGMSSALAHYYFATKNAIFLAAMRHILSAFKAGVHDRLADAVAPIDRLFAIVDASLGPDQFEGEVVSAWLLFYVRAQKSPEAARLLRVYARRLHSNLVHELRQLTDPAQAARIAQGVAAMIDGIYIRSALQDSAPDPVGACLLVKDYLRASLAQANLSENWH